MDGAGAGEREVHVVHVERSRRLATRLRLTISYHTQANSQLSLSLRVKQYNIIYHVIWAHLGIDGTDSQTKMHRQHSQLHKQ